MKTFTGPKDGLRFWFLLVCAIVFSGASVYLYFLYVAQAAAIGAWIGLKRHEADIAIAQREGIRLLLASVCCWGCSSIAGAFAMPIYQDAPAVPRFVARLILASMSSLVLTVLIGWASFSIIAASHRSIVR